MTNFIVLFDNGFIPLIQQDFLQAQSHGKCGCYASQVLPICIAYIYSVEMLLKKLPVYAHRHYNSCYLIQMICTYAEYGKQYHRSHLFQQQCKKFNIPNIKTYHWTIVSQFSSSQSTFLRSILILLSHFCLVLPSGWVPRSFPLTKICCSCFPQLNYIPIPLQLVQIH